MDDLRSETVLLPIVLICISGVTDRGLMSSRRWPTVTISATIGKCWKSLHAVQKAHSPVGLCAEFRDAKWEPYESALYPRPRRFLLQDC